MTDRALWVVVLAVGCSFAVACSYGAGRADDDPLVPDASNADVDASTSPDAAEPARDPAKPGPWAVGVRTVRLTDASRSRTFSVDVWFPVDPNHVDGSANKYELDSFLGTLASIDSPARRDATPATGAWPVVLFSHGFGGIRFQSYFLTEHLASHGFVVVSPDHPGNTLVDFAQLGNEGAAAQSAMDRPLDMVFALNAAIANQLGVSVDVTRVSATGHSFGGWTSLELARRDPRIKLAFPLAPGFRNGATSEFVATLARPLLFVGGSADDTCEFPANQEQPYMIAQTPKFLLQVVNAGHLDFSNLCEVPIAQQFIDDGCDPAMIDPAVVHRRTNAVATAFVLRYQLGLVQYDPVLAPAHVTGLGNVQYWATP
ncbi:MAG TPA: dienelactone hydrolase family protein [Kofleriaceae bacterium]